MGSFLNIRIILRKLATTMEQAIYTKVNEMALKYREMCSIYELLQNVN